MRAKVVFPPLIRTGDDKDALVIFEVEIVADDGRPFGRELIAKAKSKAS